VQDRVSIINGDLNFITLKENSYDFIICRNVLHHIINLEECLFELTKSLTSNGILVIDDFIGENKFQRTEERMQAISNFQKTVKERYNIVSPSYCRTNSKVLTNNCPFEAIRSEDVYDVVQYYF
jgi:SAM-dependent methyltransferase